jgi:tetratricopeptide (TPR) repeat protein
MTTGPLCDQAIQSALNSRWEDSIEINKNILSENPDDLPALLRLGFAYLKKGHVSLAKKTYLKVQKLDKYNMIASKYLDKLESVTDKSPEIVDANNQSSTMSPLSFLEDPGVTKITQCVHIAPQKIIATLHPGQEVYLKAKNHSIEIRDQSNRYLAALPDDLAFKMLKMISANNTYRAFVKNIEKNCISLLVREISRGRKFRNQPSFSSIISYHPANREVIANNERDDLSQSDTADEES